MPGLHKGLLIFKNVYEPIKQYLFYTRNSFFQLLYLFLASTFHAVGLHDGLAAVQTVEPHHYHLLTVLSILALNVFAFLLCCYSDPGIIRKGCDPNNFQLYPYDGKLFIPNNECPTCGIIKPARSKHCRIIDRCIRKFDHYCIWVSNAIGGNNHRHFLFLLATLVLMVASGWYHAFKALWALGKIFKCWEIAELRTAANPFLFFGQYPRICLVYVQLVTSNFPRLVVILTGCSILLPVLVYFSLHHVYLAIANETTNERHKWQRINHQFTSQSDKQAICCLEIYKNIYSRGIFKNLEEEFFPLSQIKLKQ